MSGDISTYGGLKTAIQEYTGRSNATFLANRPLFVLRAHNTLLTDLDIPLLQASAGFSINAEKVDTPADFFAVASLRHNDDWETPLTPQTVEQRARDAARYTSGRPRTFALEGTQLAFGPVPDTTYAATLLYRRLLPFFASDGATNALLARHPFAYLYGALAEAARYDKSDEDMATFEAMFQAEKARIEVAERNAALSGGTLMPSPTGGVA